MKKILAVLGVLITLTASVAMVANARTVEKTVNEWSNGDINFAVNVVIKKQVKTLFDEESLGYPKQWEEAYRNPGTVVPVQIEDVYQGRQGLLHVRVERVMKAGIIRDASGVHVVRDVSGKPEVVTNLYIIFWLITFASIVILCITTSKVGNNGNGEKRLSAGWFFYSFFSAIVFAALASLSVFAVVGVLVPISLIVSIALPIVGFIALLTGSLMAVMKRIDSGAIYFQVGVFTYTICMEISLYSFLMS